MIERIYNIVDRHFTWLSQVVTGLAAVCGSYLTYSIPVEFVKRHPVRAAVADHVLDTLPFVFPAFVVMLIALNLIKYSRDKTIAQLSAQTEDLEERISVLSENIRDVFEGYLYRFGAKIGFGERAENSERITLYIHDSEEDRFVPCGRYAPNPKYKAAGRSEYPIAQGCIAKGWEDGWHFDNEFAEENDGRVAKHQDTYNVPIAVANGFKMPSQLYAAMRIRNAEGSPIAVIVVESTDRRRWDRDGLKAEMKEQEDYLAGMVNRLRDYIPKPSGAGLKGF